MAWSNSALKIAKDATDTLGLVNKAARSILDLIDPQQLNSFEVLLYPEPAPEDGSGSFDFIASAKQAASMVLDTAVTKFYLQKLDIPITQIDYTRFDYLQAVTDMTYADECTFTFIENELSIVRTFLQNWMALTIRKDTTHGGYVFNDDQWMGRKKAIIVPQSRTYLPNLVWIEIRGLRFKSQENYSFDQQTSDPMYPTVTFACDDIFLNSALQVAKNITGTNSF